MRLAVLALGTLALTAITLAPAASRGARGVRGVAGGLRVREERPDPVGEVRVFRREFLDDGADHLAGPAPGGPEIDQDWNIVTFQILRKRRLGQLDWVGIEQGPVALAAARSLVEPGRGDPVHGVAMGTNDVQGVSHG